jgi:hypothetical protein
MDETPTTRDTPPERCGPTEIDLHFRDDLRSARALALSDGEDFEEVIFAIERLGIHLTQEISGLGGYRAKLTDLAERSPLAPGLDGQPSGETNFRDLYQIVKDARNDALHAGAYARHLTANAVKLAIVFEDALMSNAKYVRDFMVGNPTTASQWQTVCLARQAMLVNSFSYLPILVSQSQTRNGWRWLSDFQVAKFLRSAESNEERKKLLGKTLKEVIEDGRIAIDQAETCKPDETVAAALAKCKGLPVLVTNGAATELLGIVTPFDLL